MSLLERIINKVKNVISSPVIMIYLCDFIDNEDGECDMVLTPCWGYIRKPTDDEIKRHSVRPFAMFQPIEEHGYNVTFYSPEEVMGAIRERKKYFEPWKNK